MTPITIALDDDSAAQLRELARQRSETVEQTAQALLLSALSSPASASSAAAPGAAQRTPEDFDGAKAVAALLGSIPHWPGIEEPTNTTNEDIGRLIGDEVMNPHENE